MFHTLPPVRRYVYLSDLPPELISQRLNEHVMTALAFTAAGLITADLWFWESTRHVHHQQ